MLGVSLWQQIGVVKETRPYTTWSKSEDGVHSNSGIVAAKAELNRLHQKLAKEGYTQVCAGICMCYDPVYNVCMEISNNYIKS